MVIRDRPRQDDSDRKDRRAYFKVHPRGKDTLRGLHYVALLCLMQCLCSRRTYDAQINATSLQCHRWQLEDR